MLAAALLLPLAPAMAEDVPAESGRSATVLFTHDLHSHFLPQADGAGGESGGYARLKTALDRERRQHPDAITVDAGDLSIGSLIQSLYTAQAPELRTMGAMGYDAVTAGNHEFDHEGTGFAQMLNAAVLSSDKVPAMLMANYRPDSQGPQQLDIKRAMSAYGVRDHMLLERGGVTFGIFGLMGQDAHDSAPVSGFVLEDVAESAQRCVDALKEQGADLIVCLSHSGTDEDRKSSEDEKLARKVDGIDLIVSGHSHTTLDAPIQVGDTYIVSSGPYCENLGSVTFSLTEDGEKELVDYHLVDIDSSLPQDPQIQALVDEWKGQVDGGYLSRYGLSYDQVLTTTSYTLEVPESGVQQGNGLGELVADAFQWAVENIEDDAPDGPVVTVTADGVLRAALPAGELTTSMAFDVLSMGVGADGTSGYPLVSCYLTGKELRAAAEVDASVTPIMPAAQLYMGGIQYTFNTHRMFFDRVTDCRVVSGYDSYEIDDDQLYRVVTGMYSAQMLGTVKGKSMGLLSLEPKDEDGQPIVDWDSRILRDQFGNEIKEWYALAAYLRSFGDQGLPDSYAQPDGRKDVSRSWSPFVLFKDMGPISWIALAVVLLTAALAVAAVRLVLRARRRRRYSGHSGRRWPFR